MSGRPILALLGALALGCGGPSLPRSTRTRAELEATLERGASSEAASRARRALEALERSEAAGALDAADELASVARAWAEVELAEREASALEAELAELARTRAELIEEAGALEERARAERATNLARADAAAARGELERALARAEVDEATRRRARRVGLDDEPEVRRSADVLAARARVLLAASRALGAEPSALARAEAALERGASAETPLDRLAAADEARAEALLALADARRGLASAPSPEETRALVEALVEAGFPVLRDERGLGARLLDVFDGGGVRASARGRVRRLGELLSSHPFGPIVLVLSCLPERAARAEATRRLEALAALLRVGEREVTTSLLELPSGAGATDEVRVVLPAYDAIATSDAPPSTSSPSGS